MVDPVTILVTGFEPFGGSTVNSSELVVTALMDLREPGLAAEVLPTSYGRAELRMVELLAHHRPRVTIMLGLSDRDDKIRLEQVALNLDDAEAPDNDGDLRTRQPVVAGAPVGYLSTLDIERMARSARELGEEVRFSRDAGGYVCNHVFFTAAHFVAKETPGARCGFVHLPSVNANDERLARFLRILRRWLADHETIATD